MPTLRQRFATMLKLPRVSPYKEMGTSGTPVYGGFLYSAERSTDWQGQQRYRTSSEIAVNVSIVAAGIHYFLNLVSRPAWVVRPADDESAEAKELAEFMEDVIKNTLTSWPNIVRKAGMYRFHGFGIQEWTAKKREDGFVGLQDIEARPQHTIEQWDVADDGKVKGVFQRSPQTGELLGIPRGKFIYLVEDMLTDSPEGLGIYRHLLEPYQRLKVYLDLEARAFERDLRGIPIGRAPIKQINNDVATGKITQAQATAMIQGMRDFVQLATKKSDTGLLLDSQPFESIAADGPKIAGVPQWSLDLLQGSASGLPDLANAIDRIQREMARIIGTESLMMGDVGGNRALAQDKSRNLYMIANAVLGDISSAFEHDIIEPIWTLNGFPDELRPTFEVEDVAFKDVAEVTNALRDLATAGAVLAPDDPVINDVRDLLGVSQPEPMTPEMVERVDPRLTPEISDNDNEDGDEKKPAKGKPAKGKPEEKAVAKLSLRGVERAREVSPASKWWLNQPRAPSGTELGGRWVAGGSANSSEASLRGLNAGVREQVAEIERKIKALEAMPWSRNLAYEHDLLMQERRSLGVKSRADREMASVFGVRKYDPDQPREPEGSSEGGQWTDDGGGSVTVSNKDRKRLLEEQLASLSVTEEDMAELQSRSLKHKLTESEEEALNRYTNTGYIDATDVLREGYTIEEAPNKHAFVDVMNKIMDKTSLAENVTAYRGVSDSGWDRFVVDVEVDREFTSIGFLSMSAKHSVASEFGGGGSNNRPVIKFRLPKGTRAIPPSELSWSSGELEIIVDHGYTYRVVDIDKKAKIATVELVDG